MSNGKGDRNRSCSPQYRNNYDSIFRNKNKQCCGYDKTIIEDIPLGLIEWSFGIGFPNYKEFKPTIPKWWQNLENECQNPKCRNKYFLRDVCVRDPFVNLSKFCGSEFYVRYNCPKCGTEDFSRMMLVDVLKDQILNHINKEANKCKPTTTTSLDTTCSSL